MQVRVLDFDRMIPLLTGAGKTSMLCISLQSVRNEIKFFGWSRTDCWKKACFPDQINCINLLVKRNGV